MFVGHTAVALAAKSRLPGLSLGWWVTAAFALDLLWPIFLLFGIEQVSIARGATAFTPLVFDSYPWSHSLLMACVWGICLGALARWPGASPRVGLELWNSVPATLLIEGVMFTAGIALYLRATRAVDRVGVIAFWSFILISAAMWASGPWAELPPSARVLAWFALGSWLLVAWTAWADRHRSTRSK
jgi:hypothetical protein